MADFGFTTWDETNKRPQRPRGPKMQWLKLKPGSNLIRVVTPPAKWNFVKVDSPTSKFGERVKTAFPAVDRKQDPAIIAGLKPKKRYYAGVLHKSTEGVQFKIFDMSPVIYEAYQVFKDDYGHPTDFDVNLKYNKESTTPAGYYGLVPRPPAPLTDDERAIIEAVGLENIEEYLTRLCTPPSIEDVTKKLLELGWDGTPNFYKPEETEEKNSKSSKKDLEESSDDDFDFTRS